jgi:hypothetical protein
VLLVSLTALLIRSYFRSDTLTLCRPRFYASIMSVRGEWIIQHATSDAPMPQTRSGFSSGGPNITTPSLPYRFNRAGFAYVNTAWPIAGGMVQAQLEPLASPPSALF